MIFPYLEVQLEPHLPLRELDWVLDLEKGLGRENGQPAEGLLQDLVQTREVRVPLLQLPLVVLLGNADRVVDRVFLHGVRLVRRDLDLSRIRSRKERLRRFHARRGPALFLIGSFTALCGAKDMRVLKFKDYGKIHEFGP